MPREVRRGPKPSREAATPSKGIPEPPEDLDREAAKHWREVAKLVNEAGILSRLDRDVLYLYVASWRRWREAEREMAKPVELGGGAVITLANGCVATSPWYTIWTQTGKEMRTLLGQLGLTPAARSRIKTADPEDEADGKWKGID